MWIDTHCHLDDDLFKNSEEVIRLCLQENVNCMVIPAVNKNNFDQVIRISDRNKECAYALGFHPMHLDGFQEKDLEFVFIMIIRISKPQIMHSPHYWNFKIYYISKRYKLVT